MNMKRSNFCDFCVSIFYPHYHPKIKRHTLKNKQKAKCLHEIIIMKTKIKMKSRSHRYNINRPRSRRGQKYSGYKVSQYDNAYMYEIMTKQHLKLNS